MSPSRFVLLWWHHSLFHVNIIIILNTFVQQLVLPSFPFLTMTWILQKCEIMYIFVFNNYVFMSYVLIGSNTISVTPYYISPTRCKVIYTLAFNLLMYRNPKILLGGTCWVSANQVNRYIRQKINTLKRPFR